MKSSVKKLKALSSNKVSFSPLKRSGASIFASDRKKQNYIFVEKLSVFVENSRQFISNLENRGESSKKVLSRRVIVNLGGISVINSIE